MKHAPAFRQNPILGRRIPLASPILQRRLREGRRRLHMGWRVVYRGRTRPARCGIGHRPAIAAALGAQVTPVAESHAPHGIPGPPLALRMAVGRPVRAHLLPSPGVQLRHHQQLGRGGRAEHLRRSHPGLQRPGQAGQCQRPDSDRGSRLPGKAVPAPELRGLARSFYCPPSFQPQRESRALIMYRDGYAK